MTEMLVWGICFGVGALLLLTAQPIGAPRPTFADRLRSLRPEAESHPRKSGERVFRTTFFEERMRPLLEAVGTAVADLFSRFGISGVRLESKLSAAGEDGGIPLFMGQKLASFLIGFILFPLGASVGFAAPTPVLLWMAAGAAGFFLPDLMLSARLRARRAALMDGLAQGAEYLSLAVSSGLGLEQAIDEVARAGTGPFFNDLRRALKDARLEGRGASHALGLLAESSALTDVASLASAVRLAEQGAPLVQTVRAQARAVRERRRLALLEAGERAQVRMVIPVGVLILPAFFLLILYPAVVQLLKITGP